MGRHRTQEQSEILIAFMQRHKDIAIGDVKQADRENAEKLWKSLTLELNAKGPPTKEIGEWKKAWSDWRKSCLKKLAQPEDGCPGISDYEQAIIKICGLTPTAIREYESDEDSEGSTTSSDTPLKKTTNTENFKDFTHNNDPLKQELVDFMDASNSDAQLSNFETNENELNSLLKRRLRRSPEQSKILLNFMQQHKAIAMGTLKQKDDKRVKGLWIKLADDLNAWGPPTKTPTAWKKAWTDWKMFCRKKLALKDSDCQNFTKHERIIIGLCDMNAPVCQEEVKEHGDYDEASMNSFDAPIKRTSSTHDANENNIAKKRKINEDCSNVDFDDEHATIEDLDESSLHDVKCTTTSSSSSFALMTESLVEVRTGIATIQSALQELCKLMAEQNQELKRFTAESRRHHFVMEKEMIEKKRERMK